MKGKSTTAQSAAAPISLGENPVSLYYAREYARESSPGTLAVLVELTENARDNATDVTLTIDVASSRDDKGNHRILIPRAIVCEDNGTGLTHGEFLDLFCGAFSDSEGHHEVDRAGRNGVGTKTYLSIAERVIVKTTTGRATERLDTDAGKLSKAIPKAVVLPSDGSADTVWRAYEFRLHTRAALPQEWRSAEPEEMGTRVELLDIRDGVEIDFDILLERLSLSRDWLQNAAHSITLVLTGNVPDSIKKRRVALRPWTMPVKTWLTDAKGRSSDVVSIYDPTSREATQIQPAKGLSAVLDFDFRVVDRDPDGQSPTIDKPVLLLEICNALPYAPNLEGNQSARTLPLLTFLGLEHASSIGAFCNSVTGWARINSLELKRALRNNKSSLAFGAGDQEVQALRRYLLDVFRPLHAAWYKATRAGQDEAARDAVREATEEVNLALKGVNHNPFRGGEIVRGSGSVERPVRQPTRRHRWECGSCGIRWLAEAGYTPRCCAETGTASGPGDGCGSASIGKSKNQPRIGDCEILIERLGEPRVPSTFQFEKRDDEDEDVPVVRVNLIAPRYVELRGTGSLSGQAQKRLKQYLVDVALLGIAEYHAKANGSEVSAELGELYYNRMLRMDGIKKYEREVADILRSTASIPDQTALSMT